MALIARLSIPTAALTLAASLAFAKQPPVAEPVLTLRSSTRLVQVEVIVRGKDGKPITGLKQDDFEIREENNPQPIRFFSDYSKKTAPAVQLPPGMVSNRPEITGPRRGVTVVLVDSLNTHWLTRARAVQNLLKFLDGAQPDDHIALYTLSHNLKVVHDFTGDARSLMKKIGRANLGALPAVGQEPILDDLIPEAVALQMWGQEKEQEVRLVARATATWKTLEDIANHLGSTPGWKSLIWISDGLPMQVGMELTGGSRSIRGNQTIRSGEVRSFQKECDQAVKALTSSNVAVFPIDPRGLQALPEYESVGQKLGSADRPWQQTNSTLMQLATRTGGRAYVDQNDILGSLKQVTDAAQTSYSLAYYPSNSNFDGKYRRIEIRLKKAGLKADHRQGYFALDASEVKRENVQDELRAAARDPLDSAVIGIDAGLQDKDGGKQLLARIDAAELLWDEKGAFTVDTSVGLFQFDAEGRQLEGASDNISFKCDPAKAALLSQHGLSYGRKVNLNPAAAKLRMVVRSARTGAIGSITIPISR
jgi:VWFA-related protein